MKAKNVSLDEYDLHARASTKPRVFLTYTDIDKHGKEFAGKLKKQLEQDEYDVFFFDHSAKKHLGRPVWDVLAEEIDNREAVIVVCTEGISASVGADFECNHALSRDKLVVPLKYDDAVVPSPLTSRVRDSFDDGTYVGKFKLLAEILPRSYHEHLDAQRRRDEFKAKLQAQPEVELKRVEPSPRGVRLLQSIITAYNESSLVQNVSMIENYESSMHARLTLGQIGIRANVLRDWIEDRNRILLVDDFGRSVAWGERNYLQDFWSERTQLIKFPKREFNFDDFHRILRELCTSINPTVLLAPIERYSEIASWWLYETSKPQSGIRLALGRPYFVFEDGRELRVYWSNRYVPLDHFVLVDPSATRWLVKPDSDTGGRLTAEFVENEKDSSKIDFLVKTVVVADLIHRDRVKAFAFE
jgi:hypothetical protein